MRYLSLIGLSFLLTACSPEQRYNVLSALFDGVPRPGDTPVVTTGVSPQFIGLETRRAPAKLKLFRHKPTLNDRCDNCHPPGQLYLGERFDRDGGCFNCHEHDVFQEKLDRYAFLHGPVAVRACLACHDPHDSPYEALLVRSPVTRLNEGWPDPNLCYGCHDQESVRSNPAHQDQSEEQCLGCHNPHGGNKRYLLREESKT